MPGVLSRLGGSEEGNIIVLFAASIIPVIGLIGGGVDMSRIYLTHSRLQGAYDAGALIGRKTMGVGSWEANDGAAGDKSLNLFDQNITLKTCPLRHVRRYEPSILNLAIKAQGFCALP